MASLPVEARLTFIGLWTHVDDQGRCVDDPRLIKAAVWPLDDRLSTDVELDLKRLSESSLILRYKVGERSYLAVRGWDEHQRINRPTKSKLPAPPTTPEPPPNRENTPPPADETPGQSVSGSASRDPSPHPHAHLSEDSREERNREQGTGNRERNSTGGPYAPLGPSARDAEAPDSDGPPSMVEQIMTEYRENSPYGVSRTVATKLAQHVHELLADKFHPDHIREGLGQLRPRRLGPGALPSLVDEIANRTPSNVVTLPAAGNGVMRASHVAGRPSTTDQRVAAALAAGAAVQAQIDRKALGS
ncbi:hypothetical protein ABZ749_01130 [Micromonospora sp. NPDC047753]|uniref:hypothetical protein n=1 Tax=Micromonospora sp. NPDC047753 TaxID=3154817 RepID=UPI0033DA7365